MVVGIFLKLGKLSSTFWIHVAGVMRKRGPLIPCVGNTLGNLSALPVPT